MSYITDYQLDIEKGFQYKIQSHMHTCPFLFSQIKGLWYINGFTVLTRALDINWEDLLKKFISCKIIDSVFYCNSKEQCCDLCQHIVDKYFKPDTFTKNDEEFTIEIYGNKHTFFLTKNGLFYWDSKTIEAYHFNDHIPLTKIGNICNILKIDKYKHHNGKIGFETKEDAIKFAKYVIQYYYPRKETKEWCKKSRKHLAKYYNSTENIVCFSDKAFVLCKWNNDGHWYWKNTSIGAQALYEQFNLTTNQILNICNNLNLLAYFWSNILIFENATDPIKFTDYLIETYIIKKEKTYDTNRLRKERTSLSRGAKPAGSIIHGRRSKASIRCRHLEHKARIGC